MQLPRTGADCLTGEWVFFGRSQMTLVRDDMAGIPAPGEALPKIFT